MSGTIFSSTVKVSIGRFFFGWDAIRLINGTPAKGLYLFTGKESGPAAAPSGPEKAEAGKPSDTKEE